MDTIINTKTDTAYNEKYLNEDGQAFLRGFDHCMKYVIDYFYDILDITESDYLENALSQNVPANKQFEYEHAGEFRKVSTYADLMKYEMLHYAMVERNEYVIDSIDSMDDNEYDKAIKRV